ncbi:MAG: SDR family oxidoreductase [Nitrospinaceae bacterium]|jgi:NAD(P)-dependent dehydrogenase (short-subunit alcohol dehydrogenase family)|nr:SDR family oxidoreductase [Nitrospinaceae bacterium]MBT3432643.1 SDR family oxidoreductase [Nitrospinaceae bacterium]MBT3820626.1 SDR family oxidoreductase [Nitrospinaceae bacterium]MBT4094216.1 SDR family oxidoreductase [Nitrospinaceae bacterium]MBT4430863.1 SDR family oxidoreductase [Nitrospinaceae bacterium]
MSDEKIAVVTGGNKGIGKEVCRQLATKGIRVVLTARDEGRGKTAIEELKAASAETIFHPLDVTSPESIDKLGTFIEREFGHLDILVNNAAIRTDQGTRGEDVSIDTLREMMEANVYGPLAVCQRLIPLLKKSAAGRIVNFSSGMASLAKMKGGSPAYRITKTALNAVTGILADELSGSGILVNSVHPGHVKTDMGGPNAVRELEDGADTPVWLALLPDDGPTGGFYFDRKPFDW